MPRRLPEPHELLRVSEPCAADWGSMFGNERVRFCAHCHVHVHNLSEVTPREALDLVLRSGGRLCLRIERDRSGVPRTRALAEPLYQIGRRASRLAAGAFGAALTLCSAAAASAQTATPEPAQQVTASQSLARPEQGAQTSAEPAAQNIDAISVTRGRVLVMPSEPLVRAAMDDDLDPLRRLLLFEHADVNVVDKDLGTSALAHAFVNGNREMMRELLWRGARVNQRLAYRQTALMRVLDETPVEAVRDLLEAGAKVNLRDDEGNTALILAATRGRADVVELLLKSGAKINAQNKEGQTALMQAAANGSAETVRLLLQAGADFTRCDAEGHTALWHARESESDDAAALLLAYGAQEQ